MSRFLVDESSNADTRRWAAEGIAYLSLDGDVKEFIARDIEVVRAVQRVCLAGGVYMCTIYIYQDLLSCCIYFTFFAL